MKVSNIPETDIDDYENLFHCNQILFKFYIKKIQNVELYFTRVYTFQRETDQDKLVAAPASCVIV